MQLEVHVVAGRLVHAGDVLHVQQHLAGAVLLGREAVGHLAVDHQADDLVGGQLLGGLGGHPLAVAHDRHVVGDAQYLVHLVGDVDDADALGRQPVHDAEQVLDLVLGQRGGRLVQHQYLRVVGDRLGDLDHLALGDGQRADDGLRVHVDLQILEDGLRLGVHLPGVHHADGVQGEAPQVHVLHDGAAQHLVQLLVHHGHAVVQRVAGARERDGLALHRNGAAVAGIDAEQALHQRGLTRAVFAHQRVHRARPQLQPRVVQRLDAGKLLFDVQHLQQVLLFGHDSTSPLFIRFDLKRCFRKQGLRPPLPAEAAVSGNTVSWLASVHIPNTVPATQVAGTEGLKLRMDYCTLSAVIFAYGMYTEQPSSFSLYLLSRPSYQVPLIR